MFSSVLALALLVAIPTTNVGKPAFSALLTAVTAAASPPLVSLVVPTQSGSPSVASSRYLGFVSVRVLR